MRYSLLGFILVVVVLAVAAGFYFGWFGVSTSTDRTGTGTGTGAGAVTGERSNIEFSVDKGKVKHDTADAISDVQDLGRKITGQAPSDATEKGTLAEGERTEFTLDPAALELKEGEQAEITVTRKGGDQKTLQLGLSASSGSNLLATDGLFQTGEASTRVTVAAPLGARDGNIVIVAEGQAEILAVSVRPGR